MVVEFLKWGLVLLVVVSFIVMLRGFWQARHNERIRLTLETIINADPLGALLQVGLRVKNAGPNEARLVRFRLHIGDAPAVDGIFGGTAKQPELFVVAPNNWAHERELPLHGVANAIQNAYDSNTLDARFRIDVMDIYSNWHRGTQSESTVGGVVQGIVRSRKAMDRWQDLLNADAQGASPRA